MMQMMLMDERKRSSVSSTTLLTNLAFCYTFDATTQGGGGNLTLDRSVNNNFLTNNGSIVGDYTGKVDYGAALLQASSQYFSCPDNATISLGANSSFTLSAWVKASSLAASFGIIDKDDGANREYGLYYDNGANRFKFYVADSGNTLHEQSATTLGAPSTGVWYFIVGWYDGTSINIQVNGGGIDTTAYSGGSHDTTAALELGRLIQNNSFIVNGTIDECCGWIGRVLSIAERALLYNSGNGLAKQFWTVAVNSGLQTGLSDFARLEEAGTGTRFDASSNANDLTNVGSVSQAAGGKVGNASQFTRASNQSLNHVNNASLEITLTDAYTFAAWVYFDTVPGIGTSYGICQKPGSGSIPVGLWYDGTSGTFKMSIKDFGGSVYTVSATTFGTPSASTWYFVVGRYATANSGVVGISINNGPWNVNSGGATFNAVSETTNYEVGRGIASNAWCFNGRLDEVGYWRTRWLSTTEIAYLYNAGAGLAFPW